MHEVLDHGYVKVVGAMGTDIDVVNAARVSFDKEVTELEDRDERLIEFLVKHKHDSTLRHCVMTFEVYAPLMVARQWYKHAVSSSHIDDQLGWNESSRRYVTENEVFYLPNVDEWREASADKKQGSGKRLDVDTGAKYTQILRQMINHYSLLYGQALKDGLAPEQARLILPAYAMYVRWRWTASLNALLHFISLRKDSSAQYEIQEYARAVYEEVNKRFPITTQEWIKHRG